MSVASMTLVVMMPTSTRWDDKQPIGAFKQAQTSGGGLLKRSSATSFTTASKYLIPGTSCRAVAACLFATVAPAEDETRKNVSCLNNLCRETAANGTPFPVQHREMKAWQCAKIREIGEALCAAGYVTLDKQADALGLVMSAHRFWRDDKKKYAAVPSASALATTTPPTNFPRG